MKYLLIVFFSFSFRVSVFSQPQIRLNTQMHALSGMVYKARSMNFKNVFIPGQNQIFPDHVYERTSFNQLHSLEEVLIEDGLPTVPYFRVLRIIYGLVIDSTSYSIKLIYLPDCAVLDSSNGHFKFRVQYPVPDSQYVYLCNPVNGSFYREYYIQNAKSMVTTYKTSGNIQLNRYGDPSNTVYRALQFDQYDVNKDAEESTFSFQEINDYVEDYPIIYISSVPEKDEIHLNNFYKHAIAFSGYDPALIDTDLPLAADLGALCPIRCNDLVLITTPGLTGYRITQGIPK